MNKIIPLFVALNLIGCVNTSDRVNATIVKGFNVPEEQLLLLVKVSTTEYTGYYPARGCESDNCIPVSFWYTHEAEVLEIIKGKYEQKHVKFANLQHADYIDEIKKKWYIQLRKIPSKKLKEQLNVEYYVVRHDSEFQQKN